MKLATFSRTADRQSRVGAVLDDTTLLDIGIATGEPTRREWLDMTCLITAAEDGLLDQLAIVIAEAKQGRHGEACLPLSSVRLHAPIPQPAKNIFCVGLNYADHIQEGAFAQASGFKKPDFPEFFTKTASTVVDPLGDVPSHPKVTQQLDYEGELAIVLGKRGADIPAKSADDYVFGYTIINDVTARDLQHSHKQWFKGKSLDGSCPMGPVIVTKDEIQDPMQLHLTTTVNGEMRQDAHISEMIFGVADIICELSRGLTLDPGDIIATGTPNGVGYAKKPPQFLKPGDVVCITIDGIGELKNQVVE